MAATISSATGVCSAVRRDGYPNDAVPEARVPLALSPGLSLQKWHCGDAEDATLSCGSSRGDGARRSLIVVE